MRLTLVLVSDTHGLHRRVPIPDGDILIHAGDVLHFGDPSVLDDFNAFLGELPHRYKIVVAGNHDFCFETEPRASTARLTHAIVLQDRAVTLEGLKFYGSPWQPWYADMAFNLPRGEALRKKWASIPPDTDVLITHTPPHGHADRTLRGQPAGCRDLLEAVRRIGPRLHAFGHVHEAAGTSALGATTLVNASVCDVDFRPVHAPVVFEVELPGSS